MNIKRFLKTQAIVLVLPFFSLAIATAAVAIQDGNSGVSNPYSTGWSPPKQHADRFQNTLRSGSTKPNVTNIERQLMPVTSTRQLNVQDGFLPGDQDPDLPGFPGVQPFDPQVGLQDPAFPDIPGSQIESQFSRPNVQLETINPELAGWNSASNSTENNRLGDTLRSSWVMLNESGGIRGVIQKPNLEPAADQVLASIYLLREGQVIAETTANANGEFSFDGITPGTFALVAFSKTAFAAFGFNAIPYNAADRNSPDSLNILAAPRQGTVISELVKTLAPSVAFRVYRLYEVGEGPDDPPRLYGHHGLKNYAPAAIPSSAISHQPVKLINGSMTGRLHQIDHLTGRPIDVRNITVHFIQGAAVVATTRVDNYGVFQVSGLQPGTYSVIAGGRDGFGAIGVELVSSSTGNSSLTPHGNNSNVDAKLSTSSAARFVSNETENWWETPATDVFDLTLVTPETIGWINHFVNNQAYLEAINTPLPPDPYPYYYPNMHGYGQGLHGYGGGYGGGGFGGGFGFDGAGLALPVGLGAIIYSAIDDGDSGRVIASPSK